MKYHYYTCDVFTGKRFGGNQLAVMPQAEGLSDQQMQQIAREFNFSESTFVFPSRAGHTRRVRIFTPSVEVPFAGHPNVGTAFVLAATGELGDIDGSMTVTFDEKAGVVPVSIHRRRENTFWCELAAPEKLSIGVSVPAHDLATAVSLAESDVITTTHLPQVASVGLPFLIAELTDRSALERARPRMDALDALAAAGVTSDIYLYTRSGDEFDIRARMFAPLDGVPEDPATGSANCALGAMLSHYDETATGTFRWRVAQGVEMGRPSELDVSAEKKDGSVTAARVGGTCVLVGEGFMELD